MTSLPESRRVNAVASQSQFVCDPREQPISRYELWAVVAITLLGAAVRFAFPSAMAIEHYDEGVYASNLLFPDQDYRYPDRHLYAPSLIPALIEWSIILFGDKGIAPMLPSLLFGTLTIPLIWWVGRQWFGPLSGIAAAILLSLSDFHIAFSRSTLTDVPLCFWLLLAVYFFERSFRDLSWPTAIAAGLNTGLAWWTKYNGWLPLAIGLSGLMSWLFFASRDERQLRQRLCLFGLGTLTALAVWGPYWWSLPHGYGEVARNHRQYVVGFSGWWSGFIQQSEFQQFNMRGATGVSWIAVFLMLFVTVSPRFSRLLNFPQPQLPPSPKEIRLRFSEWFLVAWFLGMALATPLYRPYPRLAMPWAMATFLGFGWLFFGTARLQWVSFLPRKVSLVFWYSVLFVAAALPEVINAPLPQTGHWVAGWQSRTGLADLAPKIQSAIRTATAVGQGLGGMRAVLYVYAEPGLCFHLSSDDLGVQPAGSLNFVDIEATRRLPTFLVTGPHAHRSQAFADEFAKRADQFELIASYPYDASDFVRLDDVSATQLRAHREPLEVRLYRVRVPE
jgi:4-amino-4-deoxy-L-arabinose transferase-like glycosyltransferase